MDEPVFASQVERLRWVMRCLRDPENGCPWDRQQTFETIVPYTIEEAYEVADAIEQGDMQEIREELGDLLFQVVFYAQLGEEQDAFDFEDVARAISDKLISRHPHVFDDLNVTDKDQLHANWEAAKLRERAAKGKDDDSSILANIPKGMAPLMRAHKLQKKCAKVGFDWPDYAPVVDKIQEEVEEVLEAVNAPERDQAHIEEEIGDLLFAVVNLSRHLDVDAETALRKANHKFEQRFRQVEQAFSQLQQSLDEVSLDEMEAMWQQVKKKARPSNG